MADILHLAQRRPTDKRQAYPTDRSCQQENFPQLTSFSACCPRSMKGNGISRAKFFTASAILTPEKESARFQRLPAARACQHNLFSRKGLWKCTHCRCTSCHADGRHASPVAQYSPTCTCFLQAVILQHRELAFLHDAPSPPRNMTTRALVVGRRVPGGACPPLGRPLQRNIFRPDVHIFFCTFFHLQPHMPVVCQHPVEAQGAISFAQYPQRFKTRCPDNLHPLPAKGAQQDRHDVRRRPVSPLAATDTQARTFPAPHEPSRPASTVEGIKCTSIKGRAVVRKSRVAGVPRPSCARPMTTFWALSESAKSATVRGGGSFSRNCFFSSGKL